MKATNQNVARRNWTLIACSIAIAMAVIWFFLQIHKGRLWRNECVFHSSTRVTIDDRSDLFSGELNLRKYAVFNKGEQIAHFEVTRPNKMEYRVLTLLEQPHILIVEDGIQARISWIIDIESKRVSGPVERTPQPEINTAECFHCIKGSMIRKK